MKTITKKEAHVVVTREVGFYDENLFNDGDTVTLKKYKDVTTISLIKDGKVAVETDFIQRNAKLPAGAAARMGWSQIYVSQTTLDIIDKLIAEVSAIVPDEKAPVVVKEKFVINPAYAHMTQAEIKSAEKAWDNVQNEGFGDGYNPYRDNLYLPAKEE